MRQSSRRAFLRAAVVASTAAAIPTGFATSAGASTVGPTRLRRSTFTPHVGTQFALVAGGRSYPATLTAVGDHDGAAGSATRFTLQFAAAGALPDGIYAVSNAALRPVDLFVAPVTGRRGVLEAVIASAPVAT